MGIISKFSNYISKYVYSLKIEPYVEIKEVYSKYANDNKVFHKVHKIKSFFYLQRLHKALAKGKSLWQVKLPHGAIRKESVATETICGTQQKKVIITNNKEESLSPTRSHQSELQQSKITKGKNTIMAQNNTNKVNPVRKLPYLLGAESKMLNRVSPLVLAQQLMKYDVISFDIFDTLLLRPFDDPTSLFLLLSAKNKIMDFRNIRIDAEREARQKNLAKYKSSEINIIDIYKIIKVKTGLDIEIGIKNEMETEMEMCFANPYIMRVFKVLKENGKKIIATSDMYLPTDFIKKLLAKNGFIGFDSIYVSADYFMNKREKGLYAQIISDYGHNLKYVHIGDNPVSDYSSAKAAGFDAILYQNVNTVGNAFRAEGMSKLTGSIYSGIVNSVLHNGINEFSPHYEYGFIYGGVYVLGYCNWIHSYCIDHNIDKILFLSRDGAIYQKVFNLIFNDIPNEYVYWSRIANTKCIVSIDKYDFLTRMVHHKAIAPDKVTLHSLLRSINLLGLEKYLKRYKLTSNMLLTPSNEKIVEKFFDENWAAVIREYSETELELKTEIERVTCGCKRVAVVDVGWIGSGPYGLKRLIEHKWKLPCTVDCLIAGCKYYHPDATTYLLQNNDLHVYLFSVMQNRINYDRHAGTNKGLNNIFFELFTQDTTPSFSGIENKKFQFDYPEVENYHIINEIQNGIYDFCIRFNKLFNKYPFVYNISGYDAYLPFRMIIKDLSFIKKYFGNFSYARGVACDVDNQKVDTISSLIEGAK